MKCPHCNQYHPDNIKFCPQTGKQLPQHLSCTNPECSNFGRNNLPIDSRFCPDCGQKLSNPTEIWLLILFVMGVVLLRT